MHLRPTDETEQQITAVIEAQSKKCCSLMLHVYLCHQENADVNGCNDVTFVWESQTALKLLRRKLKAY